MSASASDRRTFGLQLACGLGALAGVVPAGDAVAATGRTARLQAEVGAALRSYLAARRRIELISNVSAYVSLPGRQGGFAATTGTTKHYQSGEPVGPRTLYEIGSNTKQMTAAVILQLEARGLLDIDQTVGRWLPQYPAWRAVTIKRLLNMTSGLPTYTEAPSFMESQAATPARHYTPEELIGFAYPSATNRLPGNSGYFYSNTNYTLAGMIAEKASGKSLKTLYQTGIFDRLGMRDTYYEPWALPESVLGRMSGGYFLNAVCGLYEPNCQVGPLAPLIGRNMQRMDISWAGAAGGVVSTPNDLHRWVRGLFGGKVLPARQLAEMRQLISTETGQPIPRTSAAEPRGFGLGIVEVYAPGLGRVWFYEGITLGYRSVYFYFPSDDIVVTAITNSQAPEGQDQLPPLALQLHALVKAVRWPPDSISTSR